VGSDDAELIVNTVSTSGVEAMMGTTGIPC
jgi:hypothetical protein